MSERAKLLWGLLIVAVLVALWFLPERYFNYLLIALGVWWIVDFVKGQQQLRLELKDIRQALLGVNRELAGLRMFRANELVAVERSQQEILQRLQRVLRELEWQRMYQGGRK